MSDESKEDRINRLKKDMEGRTSGRPMGYIYPKRIQQILHGETPVIKVGYTPEVKAKRVVGERWIDENGKEWEQKEGYTISIPKISLEDVRMPAACPSCGKDMYDKEQRLNEKIYWLRNTCFDCHVKYEMKIKSAGEDAWKKYEQSIMIKNVMSFLNESKKEILEYLPTIENKITYVTQDGHLEKWNGDISKVKEFLEKELSTIEDDLKYLERDLKELESEP